MVGAVGAEARGEDEWYFFPLAQAAAPSNSQDPRIRAIVAAGGGTRLAMSTAVIEIVRDAVIKNREKPIMVEDGKSLWLIPTHGVQAVCFSDPSMAADQRFGFALDGRSNEGKD